MSNLQSKFDTLRGWPDGSALEQSFRPEIGVELAEGAIVETKSLELPPVSVLKMLDDSLVTAPTLTANDKGKAYVVAGTGGVWNVFDIGDIVEWSGTAWVLIVAAVEAEVAPGTRAVIAAASAAGSFTGEEEKVLEYGIKNVQVTCALGNVDLTLGVDYIELTSIVGGYVAAAPSDIGETVTGSVSGHTGILVTYDNATRVWWVQPTTSGVDTFQDGDTLTVSGGGGATGVVDTGGTGALQTYADDASDVGKTVTGSVSGHTGVLIAFDTPTRVWQIAPTSGADTFQDGDVLSVGGGVGAGIVYIGGTAGIANAYVSCVVGDIGKPVVATGSGDTGNLLEYNNTTRVWLIDPDTPADTFAAADVLAVTGGTGAGIITGGGVTGLGGTWAAVVPTTENTVFINGAGSVYENEFYGYVGSHPAGAWTKEFTYASPHVSKMTSGVAASVVRDEAWLVIQGNDQSDANFADKVTCLKLMTGSTFTVESLIADTLAPGDFVSANAGVLEKTVAGGGMKHAVGLVRESNGIAGAGGIITVIS